MYHRAISGQDLFVERADRVDFLRLLGDVVKRFGIEVHAYCLLGNHYHLLVRCPPSQLALAMHRIGTLYTQGFNERHDTTGSRFRGRFGSKPITTDEQLLTAFRYVTANAVKHELVVSVSDHEWNSYRFYATPTERCVWLTTDEMLGHFGSGRELVAFIEAFEPLSLGLIRERVDFVTDDSSARDAKAVFLLTAVDVGGYSIREIADRADLGTKSSLQSALRRARPRLETEPDLKRRYDAAVTTLGTVPEVVR